MCPGHCLSNGSGLTNGRHKTVALFCHTDKLDRRTQSSKEQTSKVYPAGQPERPIAFQECYRKDIPGRIIICAVVGAEALYTRDITDTTQFDPAFIKALSLGLAADLATTLTGDMNLASQVLQKYTLALEEARRSNMTESFEIHDAKSIFVESR